MHGKHKRFAMVKTIGLWSFRFETRFYYPSKMYDYQVPPHWSSILLGHLRSCVGLGMLHTSCSQLEKSGVCTISFMLVCCTYIYMVGPRSGPLIGLLQLMAKNMRLIGICHIKDKRQDCLPNQIERV